MAEASGKASRAPRERLAYDGVAATLKGFAMIVAILAIIAGVAVASASSPSYGYGVAAGSQTGMGIAVGLGGLVTALFMYVAGHAIGLLADGVHSLRALRAQLDAPAPEPPAAEGT